MKQSRPGEIYSETFVSNFKQDDAGNLVEASATRRTISMDMYTEAINTDVTETRLYILKYNEEGFLAEMTLTTLTLQEGGIKNTFLYDNYPAYRHGKIIAKEVTKFNYESNLLRSSTKTSVVEFKSERNLDVKVNADVKKEYIYEPNGVIKTITETIGSSTTVTPFKNGIKASTPTMTYDDKGQLTKLLFYDVEYDFTYDTKGDLITYKGTSQSKQQFLETRTYDDNINPDKLLPAKFKGIPEEMRILQFTDGGNNLTSSKSVYPNRPDYEQKTIYQYNASGYPITAVTTYIQSGSTATKTTSYNYQDCQ
ncbi:hypothetical protein L0659_00945 [Dyadobacter sp. CY347]|nr:hypothetical protein [Dyadobacter sp. CY347]